MLTAPKRKNFLGMWNGNVAVRRLRSVQCTSMVALAPNTSETSSWDILDGFPKLHSRAREVKTRICTEAPPSKSLSRVEIWLVIYESCDGLESCSRDPIGYEGSPWSLYEFVGGNPSNYMDATGSLRTWPTATCGRANSGAVTTVSQSVGCWRTCYYSCVAMYPCRGSCTVNFTYTCGIASVRPIVTYGWIANQILTPNCSTTCL